MPILIAGFAMFSMFFGSGNLVFPLLVGSAAQSGVHFAIIGIILGAVVVPFIGLMGMSLVGGDYQKYFAPLGRIPSMIIITSILAFIGPFGVIPRCMTVAYGGALAIMPSMPLPVFSALMVVAIFLLTRKPNQIVDVMGRVLSPFKIGGIILLVVAGLAFSPTPLLTLNHNDIKPLTNGLIEGFQTMDLMAAFFFSGTIIHYLKTQFGDEKILKASFQASCVGALCLTVVYGGLVLLGSFYSSEISHLEPPTMLPHIAHLSLGGMSGSIVGFVLMISCLATAAILSVVFAEFLQRDILKNKLSFVQCLMITLTLSYGFSLLGFAGMRQLLGTILVLIYPALTVYATLFIVSHKWGIHLEKYGFWATLMGTIVLHYN
jgi:LIVCS family branched-chain amino acid:cation transporter